MSHQLLEYQKLIGGSKMFTFFVSGSSIVLYSNAKFATAVSLYVMSTLESKKQRQTNFYKYQT